MEVLLYPYIIFS